jgi:hypothetical protein
MKTQRLILLTSVLVAFALLPMPATQAGTLANPEIVDGEDDVQVNGGANCPMGTCVFGTDNDFDWPNSDLKFLWFSDTPDALNLSLQMKSGKGFTAGSEGPFGGITGVGTLGQADSFSYHYEFHFAIATVPYTATADFDADGVMTVGGVATQSLVVANNLYLTIPWANIGNPSAGAIVSALTSTSHGKGSMSGVTLDDHAPDANVGADYVVQNGSGAAPAPSTGGSGTLTNTVVTNSTLGVQHAFNTTTSAIYVYNWTTAPAKVQLQAASAGNSSNGAAHVIVRDNAGQLLYNRTFNGTQNDAVALNGAARNWTVNIQYTNFTGAFTLNLQGASPGTASSSSSSHAAASSASHSQSSTTSQSTTQSKSAKGSPAPGLGLVALAVVGLAILGRRRL